MFFYYMFVRNHIHMIIKSISHTLIAKNNALHLFFFYRLSHTAYLFAFTQSNAMITKNES